MARTHHTKYRFYIQKYTQNGVTFPAIDIEERFGCFYKSFTGNKPTKVQNIYEETFTEHSGSRLWIPEPSELAYAPSDVILELYWLSNEDYKVLESEQEFFDYVTGQKIEYHDTFRPNRYWQLCLIEAPDDATELLYGKQQYRGVKYKFRNFGGKYFTTSQI